MDDPIKTLINFRRFLLLSKLYDRRSGYHSLHNACAEKGDSEMCRRGKDDAALLARRESEITGKACWVLSDMTRTKCNVRALHA